MNTGERIKNRRKELGLTQEELAKRLGNKTRASVCTVEKGHEDLTTERISKYAQALETTPAYLMGWTDNPDPNRINVDYEVPVEKSLQDVLDKEFFHIYKDMSEKHKELVKLYAKFLSEHKE